MSDQTHPVDALPIRPTVAQVHLADLRHNALEARRILNEAAAGAGLGEPPGMLAVVKAQAYGHGAVPVARALQDVASESGIAWLGVALVEEGIELREAGITLPILVLGGAYDGRGYRLILEHGLTPVIYRSEHVEGLARAGAGPGQVVDVHLKIDTGMGRIGVLSPELPAFLAQVREHPGLRIDGVLSHFANADLADAIESEAQLRRFAGAIDAVREAGHAPRWTHLANSAAILGWSGRLEGHTLVRPGLMLYGYRPAAGLGQGANLRPALTWSTRIVHLKRVPKGFKVSYGHIWTAKRESLIATIPVGYADGYDRRHSNGGPVLVGGRRCPVAGRVCMDMCMVDVTDVPGVQMGDEVVLLGRQGDALVGADELAEHIGTIPYEVLCAIGERVPRRVS